MLVFLVVLVHSLGIFFAIVIEFGSRGGLGFVLLKVCYIVFLHG